MKTAILNGWEIQDRDMLHRTLKEQLGFPDWYGSNLDALYDMLTESAEPIRVVVADPEALSENLGGYYDLFRTVLRDVGDDLGNVTLELQRLEDSEP